MGFWYRSFFLAGKCWSNNQYIEGDEMDEHFDLEAVEGQGTRSSIQGLVSKGTLNFVFDLLIV